MTATRPRPCDARSAAIFCLNSAVVRPLYLPELMATPSSAEQRLPARTSSRASTGDRFSRIDDGFDRQLELLGEFEVAFVVCRHGHDRASAVADEHVVGDPDWCGFVVHGIDGVAAGEDASFFFGELGAVEIAFAGGGFAISFDG